MLLVDTSVWVKLFRQNSADFKQTLIEAIDAIEQLKKGKKIIEGSFIYRVS